MAEALRANIGSESAILLQRGPVDPKFQVEGVAPTNHSSCQKTKLNDLSYGIKIWTCLSSVLSQYTRLTDGRTDRQTDRFLLTRSPCIQRSAVMITIMITAVSVDKPCSLLLARCIERCVIAALRLTLRTMTE